MACTPRNAGEDRTVCGWPGCLAALLALAALGADAAHAVENGTAAGAPATPAPFALSPPVQEAPIDVHFEFALHDVNRINSVDETFEFSGVMTLTWQDPREAFDPAIAGVREKLYQGRFQFNEVATSWYPQIVLLNQAGMYERSGIQLRIRPDGTSILTEKITAVAEARLDMRPFPFDAHRLDAVFSVLGHGVDDVALGVDTDSPAPRKGIRVPGYLVQSVRLAVREQASPTENPFTSARLSIAVAREAIYIRRLITGPMIIIVLLSFSIFWMDKASLADRNSISFIGVLTNVAFQQTAMNVVPPVSYITLLTGFLSLSFLTMAATVPVNLLVSELDKRGRSELGHLVDRRCRWISPTVHLSSIALITTIALS